MCDNAVTLGLRLDLAVIGDLVLGAALPFRSICNDATDLGALRRVQQDKSAPRNRLQQVVIEQLGCRTDSSGGRSDARVVEVGVEV